MHLKSFLSAALVLALATCSPAAAQQSIPQLGVDKSGSCRNFSIYDPTKPGADKMVSMLCIDTTTHSATLPSVAITGGTIAGITDLAVVDGGTGASSVSAARTNLGVEDDRQTFTPTEGATVNIAASSQKIVRVYMNTAGALTALTVNLPTPVDGQIFAIRWRNAITGVTLVAPTGTVLAGISAGVSANSRTEWEYQQSVGLWWRVD